MTEVLQQEIRTLRSLHNSERDPEGRVFAPLADAYRRSGQIPEAVRLLNDGLARLPDFVPGHVVAAQLYVEQGLAEEAGFAARRALDLDPDNVSALRSLLRVLDEKGEALEAAEVRDHLVALEPDFRAEVASMDTVVRPALGAVGATPVGGPGQDLLLDAMEDARDEVDPMAETFVIEGDDVEGDLEATFGQAPEPDGSGEAGIAWPSLGELEPEAESVFDLDALSPGSEPAEEDVLEIGLLSADEPEPTQIDVGALPDPEPVYDLVALAPDEPEEAVLDMAALAPDEPEEAVLDVAALAPDEPEEAVLDVGALAPDEPEEAVLDMAALAPDEPEEAVLDMAALAPDEPEEAVLDMAALAPDEPVFDMDELAPPSDAAVDDYVEVDFLSPDEPDEIVIDLDALRPDVGADADDIEAATDPVEEPRAEVESSDEAADAPQPDFEADESRMDADEEESAGEPVYTRTLAELYVKQGAIERALAVLRHLRDADPQNGELADRIAELEEGRAAEGPLEPVTEAPDRRAWRPQDSDDAAGAEEVEALARDLAGSGGEVHDVESPFAWVEEEAEAPSPEGPTIRDYFDGLLAWESEEER